MVHSSLSLARRLDLSEIGFCALASRAGQGGADTLVVGGGRAICGAPGSPLNKVLGLGLGTDVSDADLDAIDEFYDAHESPAQVELCPLAAPGLGPRLASRGYVLQGFENQLVARLDDVRRPVPGAPVETGVSVAPTVTEVDEDVWIDVVSRAFAAGEHAAAAGATETPPELREAIRAFRHGALVRYLARDGGNPAGGGAAYCVDGVLGLCGTGTLPAHRGRGVQHALVGRMLDDARGRADVATATTEPGSRSQRTFERFGFRVAYTRAILVRSYRSR